MINKQLLEEINRVKVVMGLNPNRNMRIISETPATIARFLKMLGRKKGIGKFIVPGGPVEKLFTDNMDFYWKLKNKFSDELADVTDVDGLMKHILDNPKLPTTRQMMVDMFMANKETRQLLIDTADNLVGGLKNLDDVVSIERFLQNLDDVGIPITKDDLVKVGDDIYKSSVNPIRVSIANAGKINNNLFGELRKKGLFKKNMTSTSLEKGKVIINIMQDQGVKTSKDAQNWMLKIGMNEADAAKIRIAIERGTAVDTKMVREIFEKVAKSTDNEIQLALIDMVRNNKFLRNKIQRNGNMMDTKELRTLLNLSDDVPEHLLQDIIETIGPKKVRNPFRRGELEFNMDPQKGWYGTYLRRKLFGGMSLGKKGLYSLYNTIYTLFLISHLVPFGMMFGKADENDPWWMQWILGKESGGDFNCKNNIECVLKPSADTMAKTTNPKYEELYLEDNLTVYSDAAQWIGTEIGTYNNGKWHKAATLGDFSPPMRGVDEYGIADKLNERPSLFGMARIATDYFNETGRGLWDDLDLMKWGEDSYASFLSNKFRKFRFLGIDTKDVGKEILRSLMNKPQRTIKDSDDLPRQRDFRDEYDAMFTFPKELFLTDDNDEIIERWKPCYKGVMPTEFVEAMSSVLPTEQDFGLIAPDQFNGYYNTYAPQKFQTKSNAYMRPTVEKDGREVYNWNGTTECGKPEELRGLKYEELERKAENSFDNFIDGLESGNPVDNKPDDR